MQNFKLHIKISLLFVFCVLSLNSFAQNYALIINVTNIKKAKGTMEIGLFTDTNGFPDEGTQQKKYFFTVNNLSETFEIKNIKKGEYAIAIYHDENEDGKCNRNFIGMPKEPYGFSNNYRPRFSAPDFDDCRFYLRSDTTISIKLVR